MDLRDTQGGDAGQLVAEKLARRIIGWMVSRYEEPSSYPADAPRGPIVAITDEYASCGGDVVIQALKSYGIATVVGTRTWGGVRGVNFKYELVNGTIVAAEVRLVVFRRRLGGGEPRGGSGRRGDNRAARLGRGP